MLNGTEVLVSPGGSPFDAMRHTDPDGREYWLGRELMPHLGYRVWENFAEAVRRARAACINAGQVEDRNFRGITKSSIVTDRWSSRERAGRLLEEVELSRFGAYLVSMNGDPRKPEVAAAQTYFATATRWAETAQRSGFEIPKDFAAALELAAKQTRALEAAELEAITAQRERDDAHEEADRARRLALEAERDAEKATKLALAAATKLEQVDRQLGATLGELGAVQPKVEAYDAFLDAAGAFPLAVAAAMLGTGRQKLITQLCAWKVLVSKSGSAEHLRPYAEHIHEGRFVVKNTDVAITHRDGTKEVIIRGTTLVTPKGLDYIRRRLDREAARPKTAAASVPSVA